MANTGKPARFGRLSCIALAAGIGLAGCKPEQKDQTVSTGDTAAAAARIDSILPMDEAIRRFREGLPEVTSLNGGALSRDELVRDFVRAVEANDTAAVQRMVVSQAEYAYLYFPTSIYMNKPYQQAPALAWFLNIQNSEKGITRVMRRLGGRDLGFEGYECGEKLSEGSNNFWRSCILAYRDPLGKSRVERRLFGAIIERDGRYKFLSYANDL